MFYEKEGPNVQSQSEHTAYVNMKNKQQSRFSTREEKLEAENKWMKEKMRTQARENGGWFDED